MRHLTLRAVAVVFALMGLSGCASAPGVRGLAASGRYEPLRDHLMLFGQFVGDWECEVVAVDPDGTKGAPNRCEWNWGWVLQGRGIQDVWIVHSPNERTGTPFIEYGTTLRL